jgi:hypothetical protein
MAEATTTKIRFVRAPTQRNGTSGTYRMVRVDRQIQVKPAIVTSESRKGTD